MASRFRHILSRVFRGYCSRAYLLTFLPLYLFTFTIVSCDSLDIQESPVPAYNVRYSCNISTINASLGQTDQPHLDAQPGVVLINQYLNASDVIGVCGLLLFHAAMEDSYYAYDLACPYCYQKGKPIALGIRDVFIAQCPDCNSEFGAIQYGSPAPTAGPANEHNLHLRQYRARLSSYSTLTVTN